MDAPVFDPFGDFETEGYLRNRFKAKNLTALHQLETTAYKDNLPQALRALRRPRRIAYHHICETHRLLFDSVYPWAGQDRLATAPDIAIAKRGYNSLFAHPADIQRAAGYALERAQTLDDLRTHPGEIFGYLAHAHPFLEGNGRTLLTVHAELCRRAGFHIAWEQIDKTAFLAALTHELERPGSSLDDLVRPHLHPGPLTLRGSAGRLGANFSR